MTFYRDGRDGVALHGDQLGDGIDGAVVAIVSLGEPRRIVMKRVMKRAPGRVHMAHANSNGRPRCAVWRGRDQLAFRLGYGDPSVVGGTCQRTWLHGVPKTPRAEARISVMFR